MAQAPAPTPQDIFNTAVKNDQTKKAQTLFAAGGINVNEADTKGVPALLYACENGNAALVTWLLEQGATINARDAQQNTCLHRALKPRKAADILNILIANGIEINAPNEKGETALIQVVRLGKKNLLTQLIEGRADLSARDSAGFSALSAAVQLRRAEFVSILLTAGAPVNVEGQQPLLLAYNSSQLKVFEALLAAKANPDLTDEKGVTLLLNAVRKERLPFAEALIAGGANVNQTDESGNPLITVCVKQNIPELTGALLEKGVSVETKDSFNKTLILMAHENILKRVSVGREKMYKLLIEKGAAVNTQTPAQKSLLHELAEAGRVPQVQLLIDHQADLNARDKVNNLPLHAAAGRGQPAVLKILAEKYTDINIRGDSGNTAMLMATRVGCGSCLKFLKEKGADIEVLNNAGESPLALAISKQDAATAQTLIGLGAKVNDTAGKNPLIMEIAKADTVTARTAQILQILTRAGADINKPNVYGNNALSYALNRKNLKMTEALLAAGAKSEAGDAIGNTFLHKLALNSLYGKFKNQELTEWLNLALSWQAPDWQNSAGQTPLHLAAMQINNSDVNAGAQLYEQLLNYSARSDINDQEGKAATFYGAKHPLLSGISHANQPGPAPRPELNSFLSGPENEKVIDVTGDDKHFYWLVEIGKMVRLLQTDLRLNIEAQSDLPGAQKLFLIGGNLLVAGAEPGDIEGAPDKKCRVGQNLVIFVKRYSAGLSAGAQSTWGKPGACQRTSALALSSDGSQIWVYAEFFGGTRFLRRLTDDQWDATEISKQDKFSEFSLLPENQAAIVSLNQIIELEKAKTVGKVSRQRGMQLINRLSDSRGIAVTDNRKLSGRQGFTVAIDDAEGKIVVQKFLAGYGNVKLLALSATSDGFFVSGETTATIHGQDVAEGAKAIFVAFFDNNGRRLFTRVIPFTDWKFKRAVLSVTGKNLMLIGERGDKKNMDTQVFSVDRNGNSFQ